MKGVLSANLLILVVKLQFSSVQFFFAKVNYNARIHIRIVSWQGSPEETRRLMKPGLSSCDLQLPSTRLK